jgi:HEAT repeat protein
MFKFQFNRLEEPTQPTWNHDPANALYDATDAGLLQPIVKHVWNWLIGRMIPTQQPPVDQDIITWKTELDNSDGKIRLNAAYNLALNNRYDILIERLYHQKEICRIEAAYALTACRYNKDTINALQAVLNKEEKNECIAYCIAFIFSEMGSLALDTLPLLINIVQTSDSCLVQQYCCEALGTIQSNKQQDIEEVVRCLTNILSNQDQQNDVKEKSQVRFVAALSIAKIGTKAVQAISTLKEALYVDENRYVNGNALIALERIGTDEALRITLDYLKMSRWCAKTTSNSPY